MKKYFFKCYLFITVISLLISSAEVIIVGNSLKDIFCKSSTIRSVEDFNQLQNCTVLTGFVRIVEMDFTPASLEYLKSSNIEEITEYLLVYRVKGLDSLERLFPNLIVIRGVNLFYDRHALVIVENIHLKNIGLLSLLRVLEGDIRIESNPSLCFVDTVKWIWIVEKQIIKNKLEIKNNKSPNLCPHCYNYENYKRSEPCWSLRHAQRNSLDYIEGQKCFKSHCIVGCSDIGCKRCVNYVSSKGCEDSCLPPKYSLAYKRQCVTNCTEWGLIPLGIECVEKCPKHYEVQKVKGVSECVLNCKGNFVVNNIADLEGFADCTSIIGSLTIEMHETDIPIVQHLEDAFSNLREITDYLRILHSPQLIALYFFKNLRVIGGMKLFQNRYSLYVVGNDNLHALWPKPVSFLNGCIYFHLNSRLCYEKVAHLEKNLINCRRIEITDFSFHSNGDRAICDADVSNLNAEIIDVSSNAAVVQLSALSMFDFQLLVGYVFYYKEAPFKNVTKYDGRHSCGIDRWFTEVTVTKHRRHIIKNLKPNTQYAYFVNCLTITEYPYFAEYGSQIQYFQTLPDLPGMVEKLYYIAVSSYEIELHWWPPIITNGILDKYVLQYEATDETITSETVDQNTTDICQCPMHDTESRVATPHVENFFKMEALYYLDALLDFFYFQPREGISKYDWVVSNAQLKLLIEKLNQAALITQHKEEESYDIPHRKPVCSQPYPSVQEQLQNDCVPLQVLSGIEVPGERNSFRIPFLDSAKTYRLSLRACVLDLENGCGAERVILARTLADD